MKLRLWQLDSRPILAAANSGKADAAAAGLHGDADTEIAWPHSWVCLGGPGILIPMRCGRQQEGSRGPEECYSDSAPDCFFPSLMHACVSRLRLPAAGSHRIECERGETSLQRSATATATIECATLLAVAEQDRNSTVPRRRFVVLPIRLYVCKPLLRDASLVLMYFTTRACPGPPRLNLTA